MGVWVFKTVLPKSGFQIVKAALGFPVSVVFQVRYLWAVLGGLSRVKR